MWQLQNKTPFPAEGYFIRDKAGTEHWAITLKATFTFDEKGRLTPAEVQEPLLKQQVFYGAPAQSSLRYDIELLPERPATDVLLIGEAVAPQGQRVSSLEVGFSVGPISKRLQVTGDRVWKREWMKLVPSEPRPFKRMPLVWERAYGGVSAELSGKLPTTGPELNPVGVGAYPSEREAEGKPLPNLEHPSHLLRSWLMTPPPWGVGPLSHMWPQRLRHGGTYDHQWQKERMPLLPLDFDPRYYQSAPEDQQVPGYLKGGEKVELLHLTPTERISFALPRLPLRFVSIFGAAHSPGEGRPHEAVLQQVRLEPSANKVVLIYYTQIECHQTLYRLRETRVWLEDPLLSSKTPQPLGVPTEPSPRGGRA
ncbi:MAG: DUF2169 domain-containing protein [Myxococcota bacterium]